MSIKKILIPAFVLGVSHLVACGGSDAFIGDTAGGGSSGTTGTAGKTGDTGGSSSTSGGTTSVGGTVSIGGSTASGGTASAGTSNGGAGGECTGHYACPAIFCSGPLGPATPASNCCPVCGTGGGGGGPLTAGGASGSSNSGGSGGGQDCSKPHVCPAVLYQCAPGQPETPPGECCQVCVSTGGTAGSGGASSN